MLVAAGIAIGLVLGAALLLAVMQLLGRSSLGEAAARRDELINNAKREAENLRREAEIEAREQAVRVRSEAERDAQERRGQITKLEERVLAKQDELEAKLTELLRREQGLADRETNIKELQVDLKEAKNRELGELERISGLTVNDGKDRAPRARGGRDPPRAGAPRQAPGRGGAARRKAARAQPRRRRAPAGRRQPCRRDDLVGRRAAQRRHEGPHHRPRGTEHPHPRASDRRRHHHRRHAAGCRPLVVRRHPPRDRPPDAREADRGRPDPARADRGDVLPVEGRDRGSHPAGRRAGCLRGERGRVPPRAREDPRPPPLPDELRPERPQAHARGRAPGGDHGHGAGRRCPHRQTGGDAPRPRQGAHTRDRGIARADLGRVREALRRVGGGRPRDRRAPLRDPAADGGGGPRRRRRRDLGVEARRPRRHARELHQAAGGARGDRRPQGRRGEGVRAPGRP